MASNILPVIFNEDVMPQIEFFTDAVPAKMDNYYVGFFL